MRKTLKHTATAAAMPLLAAMLVAVSGTPAAASAALIPPASVQGVCDSDSVPLVVASDVAAQSDIYSAVTLAGVLGDACIVLAGSRGEAMSGDQQARLDAAAAGGYVVGGQAAVPDGKIAGRTMARLGGADRWATALLVGEEAAYPGTAPTTTVPSAAQFIPTPGSSSGSAATRVRVPPASGQGDCDVDSVPVVVASDLAAQSDIYSAVTLAGVLGDACIVLAGPRSEDMPAEQQTRLDEAAEGGYVVGGLAAVPDGKIAGRTMARLGGTDRWATALLVGEEAAEPGSAPTKTIEADEDSQIEQVVRQLSELTVAVENRGGYDRGLFKHWVDADGDSCDARREVLIAEAVVAPSVGSGCSLSGGEWLSRYDGKTTSGSGSAFDVDHLVPLAEAWESGANDWTADRREQYANDLGYSNSLIAVSASSNRSKGAKDPAEWLPPTEGVHCWYAAAWVQVKTRWGLTVDQAEANKLGSVLAGCSDSDLGNLPQAEAAPDAEADESEAVGDCHPAYEPCLPNLPGDALNCGDLTADQRPVRVKEIGVDPYRLDRDGDGWGCTS
ncbi:HNH endonuclease family protein [Candidatus Poriferisodalis sp.]|uniref:HNH endonuclease family protein n=1 Tax=Candidatus Poriferisodalis sp. TaxID=3101277 RepID=UPI003B025281